LVCGTKAKADLDLWVQTKKKAEQEGRDVVEALTELCVQVRKPYDRDTQVTGHEVSA